MPKIFEFKCNKCDLSLPAGFGGHMYVEDQSGKRVPLTHPGENYGIAKVLNIDVSIVNEWMLRKSKGTEDTEENRNISSKVGFESQMVCFHCLQQYYSDIHKDTQECPKCKSNEVYSVSSATGKTCPKCHTGVIEQVDTGSIS